MASQVVNGGDELASPHTLKSALHVASMIDPDGSRTRDLRESYWGHATGALFSPQDLIAGEKLLLDLKLVVLSGEIITPTPRLENLCHEASDEDVAVLAAMFVAQGGSGDSKNVRERVNHVLDGLQVDSATRERLLLAVGRRFDTAHLKRIGDVGEFLVVEALTTELREMGQDHLTKHIQHVSLVSDQLGYDIVAPLISGGRRLIEVKATTRVAPEDVTVFVSRNEADTGINDPAWVLTICEVTDVDLQQGHVIGWCSSREIEDLLPSDGASGRWETARLDLPLERLMSGCPSAAV